MDILEDLKYRGLINQITDSDGLTKLLNSGSCVLYCGFDVTADSLQLGNLLPLLTLKRFQLFGHQPIALLGDGTSLIGDPSGKQTERVLNSKKTVANWSKGIKRQMDKIMSAGGRNKAKVIGNYDWLGKIKPVITIIKMGIMIKVTKRMRSRVNSNKSFLAICQISFKVCIIINVVLLLSNSFLSLAKVVGSMMDRNSFTRNVSDNKTGNG